MNKVSKKLFLYFLLAMLFFTVIVFAGCYRVVISQMESHIETELSARTGNIRAQLEDYVRTGDTAGEEAYLRHLDDIALAEAYIILENGETVASGSTDRKTPVPVKECAEEIFRTGEGFNKKLSVSSGSSFLYALEPLKRGDKLVGALVVREKVDLNRRNYMTSAGFLLLCTALAMVMSALLIVFLIKRFMRTVFQVADVTKALAGGDYKSRVGKYENNEFGMLAKETDILAQKLEDAQHEGEKLKNLQKDYLANLSHELRTPIAVIRSSVEAMRDGMIPENELKEYENQLLSETVSLQRLVDDMLELSRLENEGFAIDVSLMNVYDALEDGIRSVRMLAREKDIIINVESSPSEWLIHGDYGRIRQMFVIVLDNAVKYSDAGSSISIRAWNEGGRCLVSVRDEGCGIKPEDQEHIFEKFYRGSRTDSDGSGLGLVIMKNIADRHGISVKIHSSEDCGTECVFDIPNYSR